MKPRYFWPILAVLAVSGCAPAFLANLNSAAPLTRQMTPLGTIGPFDYGNNTSTDAVRFLPAKPTTTLTVQSGFVITNRGTELDVSCVYLDPTTATASESSGSLGYPLSGADPNYPLYQFDVANTTTTANIVVFSLDPADPAVRTAGLLQATLVPSPALSLTAGVSPNPQTMSIAGASSFASPPPADSFSVLAINTTASPPTYGAAFAIPVGAGSVLSSVAVSSNPLLPTSNRYLYYHVNTSNYADYYSGGQWTCYQWADGVSMPVLMAGITHRIDAALTSGDLLSTEGGILRLYDSTGTQVLSVALGGLQFCYEAYVGAVPYVFFSLTLSNPHGKFEFATYAIPTSSIRGLSR